MVRFFTITLTHGRTQLRQAPETTFGRAQSCLPTVTQSLQIDVWPVLGSDKIVRRKYGPALNTAVRKHLTKCKISRHGRVHFSGVD
ncbi:hypothetical protein J6590_024742 [Homalodisca vitripennis]|nr:hypothetical protein J6590_024742 [Homalodisca vitripennis]